MQTCLQPTPTEYKSHLTYYEAGIEVTKTFCGARVIEVVTSQDRFVYSERVITKRLLGGRPNINPVLMAKMLVLQAWYRLSNTELEQQANDRLGFLKLLGYPRTRAFCI